MQIRVDEHHVDKENPETVEKRQDAHRHEILSKPSVTPSLEPIVLPATGDGSSHVQDEGVHRIVDCLEILGSKRVFEFESELSSDVVGGSTGEGVVVGAVCEPSRNGKGQDGYYLGEKRGESGRGGEGGREGGVSDMLLGTRRLKYHWRAALAKEPERVHEGGAVTCKRGECVKLPRAPPLRR